LIFQHPECSGAIEGPSRNIWVFSWSEYRTIFRDGRTRRCRQTDRRADRPTRTVPQTALTRRDGGC